ncbi:hypothetical protein BD311DRAFT_235050 [Dichomitus squalens]|uniref:Uncharacterized protein n=1 Tax=Dichomitus squalens TaxID=114155 RepID=A0A4Q9MV19_9APHY|nr:hypothetical protein BD311DRAFT_235050 [Dichomitus squalens]
MTTTRLPTSHRYGQDSVVTIGDAFSQPHVMSCVCSVSHGHWTSSAAQTRGLCTRTRPYIPIYRYS